MAEGTSGRPILIALLTDFGVGSVYAGAMKGVIAATAPGAAVIDLTHGVSPQAVDEGSFLLGATYRHFPDGTTFLAVVDPGVGTAREAVLLEAAGRLFIAPDNGLLSAVIEREGAGARAWWIRERRHFLSEVSATFHGRDVLAPVAARLASGAIGPADVGPEAPLDRLVRLPRDEGGKVVYVDPFGNLVTDSPPARVRSVAVAGRRIDRVARTYGEVPEGELFAYAGSFGTLEIGVSGGSAARTLGVGRGAPVRLDFTEVTRPR